MSLQTKSNISEDIFSEHLNQVLLTQHPNTPENGQEAIGFFKSKFKVESEINLSGEQLIKEMIPVTSNDVENLFKSVERKDGMTDNGLQGDLDNQSDQGQQWKNESVDSDDDVVEVTKASILRDFKEQEEIEELIKYDKINKRKILDLKRNELIPKNDTHFYGLNRQAEYIGEGSDELMASTLDIIQEYNSKFSQGQMFADELEDSTNSVEIPFPNSPSNVELVKNKIQRAQSKRVPKKLPHACEFCECKFSSKQNLKKHMALKRREKDPKHARAKGGKRQ